MADKVSLKKMNNKYMKGYYVYTKRNGFPGRYFRYKGIYPLQMYLDFYLQKIEKKHNDRINTYKKKYKMPKSEYSKVSIDSSLKKGIVKSFVRNVLKLGRTSINNINRDIMKNAVRRSQDVNVMSQESNVKKIRFRFSYSAKVIGNEGETLMTIEHIGKKTPREVISDINELLKRGQRIESESPKLTLDFKNKGYMMRYYSNEGFVRNVTLKTMFRKI